MKKACFNLKMYTYHYSQIHRVKLEVFCEINIALEHCCQSIFYKLTIYYIVINKHFDSYIISVNNVYSKDLRSKDNQGYPG